MNYQKAKMLLLFMMFFWTTPLSFSQEASDDILTVKGEHPVFLTHRNFDTEEEFAIRIERGNLIKPEGSSAFDTYQTYLENHSPDDLSKKMKRSLVAALAEVADKALTEYFDKGGEFIIKYFSGELENNVPIDQYYFVAADLLGEGHFLFGGLQSKGYFVEALKMRYLEGENIEIIIDKLEKSKAIDPLTSYIYYELGLIYFEAENYSKACENFTISTKLNDNWEKPLQKLKLSKEALTLSENANKKG